MKAYRIFIGILILFVLMIMDPWDDILGQHLRGCDGKGLLSGLTEEQREAVQGKVKEMRTQGATREEVGTAVREILKGYGVEPPENAGGLNGPTRFGYNGFYSKLTDEQRETVLGKIKEMRSQSAAREEIHAAVAELLKGYGVELPENCPLPGGPKAWQRDRGGFWDNLTKEQEKAVREKIKEMRSQDANREEIHAAVAEMLKGYGIEVPEDWAGPHGRGGFWEDLTKEQREAVREKISEMRNQDATPEEIHAAVAELLKGYGIEVPENWHAPIGFGRGLGGFGTNLTDEQREAVRGKIKEMRSQGATREEIRTAVREMLEGYGIKLPEKTESNSSENTSKESVIKSQNFPNPFNPETGISYTLPEDSYIKLTIYNIQGQKVKQLVDEYQSAGTRKVVWDGCGESGETVASGIYFYRIEAGPNTETNRMVLLK